MQTVGKAKAAFEKLMNIWKSSPLSSTNIRMFKSNVITVLLYRCESWRMTKGNEVKLDTFQQESVRWLVRISVLAYAGVKRCARELTWKISHVMRMDNSFVLQVALRWAADGKRKRGRPRKA